MNNQSYQQTIHGFICESFIKMRIKFIVGFKKFNFHVPCSQMVGKWEILAFTINGFWTLQHIVQGPCYLGSRNNMPCSTVYKIILETPFHCDSDNFGNSVQSGKQWDSSWPGQNLCMVDCIQFCVSLINLHLITAVGRNLLRSFT